MRKKELEILLENIPAHPIPKPYFEQYTIPTQVAAEILFIVDRIFGDVKCKKIAELGCGTGRLSIGAALLGACSVVAADIDPKPVSLLRCKIDEFKLRGKIQPIVAEIQAISGKFDTVLQNPPFGIRRYGADRPFIVKALEVSRVAYSLHKADYKNRYFIKRLIKEHRGNVTHIFEMKMKIPRIFPHHRKKIYEFNVDLYRMISNAEKREFQSSQIYDAR